MTTDSSPVVIGGSGGSGTRMIALSCKVAGYDLGARLNDSYDALDFAKFYDDWVNPYLLGSSSAMPPEQTYKMRREFDACLSRFMSSIKDPGQWGFKNPRSMLVLPFLDSVFSALRFVHVVRDGRDMAYSKNQHQLEKHGDAVSTPEDQRLSPPQQSIAFWSRTNMLVARYGEEVMGGRYFRCRFEDLCLEPETSLERLADFLRADFENPQQVIDRLIVPKSIGRWKEAAADDRAQLAKIGHTGLEYFGYPGAGSDDSGAAASGRG